MNYHDTLLFASLIQVSNITTGQEKKYWKQGIFTLQDLSESIGEQLSIFPTNQPDEIQELIDNSFDNINQVASIFSEKSGKKDFYRIAYSIPEDVMFLDIETTGLSQVYHYITVIGWVLNGEYNIWLHGTDPTGFIQACKKAKMIVTFNGTRFDNKFVDNAFPDVHITDIPHLDLMHLCRRFNLTNGQKDIEHQLGFKRPDDVGDCDGKEAIVLWYKFIFGDDSALSALIKYNFYDIIGMTYILDKVFFRKIYGKEFPKVGKPLKFYRARQKCNIIVSKDTINQIRCVTNQKNFDFTLLDEANQKKIVGIDLAGVINKSSNTGICLLIGNNAYTKPLKTDDEIIQFIVDSKADIVSIDAPLSLPFGRTSVYNNDPQREQAGIMRYSERLLHSRGVNSYPALIDSMQELTKRGINLAQQLRKMGYPVIECFPGAAQDILQLPRKKTDLSLLKAGLARLGIIGDYQSTKVVHDELDAITAAIVGKFFVAGYYEPIGIPEENYMIIPCSRKHEHAFEIAIGLTGHIASGKTTAARYLAQNGFRYCRYSQIIAEDLREKKINVNRQTLQAAGGNLFDSSGQYALNKKVDAHLSGNEKIVIDGMRHYEDYTYWKEKCFSRFLLIYIDTNREICSARSVEKEYTSVNQHHVEQEIDKLRNLADIVITNNDSIDDLYDKLNSIMNAY